MSVDSAPTTDLTRGPLDESDVIVVGAGPTGLLLATDLASAGVRVRILEKREEGLKNLTRSFSVHSRTLEQLDTIGLAEEIIRTGSNLPTLPLFGGLNINFTRLPTKFPFMLVTPQYNVERILLRKAAEAGVVIDYGREVVGLRQDDVAGVEVDVRSIDGTTGTYLASYAVGTDGVRSPVRNLLNISFHGEPVIRSIMLADVKLNNAPAELLTVEANSHGFAFVAPFGDGWYRIIAWSRFAQRADDAPVDFEEIRDLVTQVLGTDLGMYEPRWLSRFHSDERQADRYRVGRVFLAGDAAHVHSPAGGLGMNIGLQDATNLSWKLAAVLKKGADVSLLDTYQEERHPVAKSAVRTSGALIRAAVSQCGRPRLAQQFLVGLSKRLGPLGSAIELRVGRKVSGIGVVYRRSRSAHRMVGRYCPDVAVTVDGSRSSLSEVLRRRQFVLLSTDPRVLDAAVPWPGRVLAALGDSGRGDAVLVRPDGYICWAGDRVDLLKIGDEIRAWAGPPSSTESRPSADVASRQQH